MIKWNKLDEMGKAASWQEAVSLIAGVDSYGILSQTSYLSWPTWPFSLIGNAHCHHNHLTQLVTIYTNT